MGHVEHCRNLCQSHIEGFLFASAWCFTAAYLCGLATYLWKRLSKMKEEDADNGACEDPEARWVSGTDRLPLALSLDL